MSSERRLFAEVAVPLPIASTLTYELSPDRAVAPGSRVRVRVGRRRLLGVVMATTDVAPSGIDVRPIERVVDPLPVVPAELLSLAAFVSEYYLAPIGEVVRSVVPAGLEPWGDRRVWLTDAGALARHDGDERQLVEALREAGRTTLAELQEATGVEALDAVVRSLAERGHVMVGESGGSGSRYVTALELAAGELDELLERCGRSRPGREVVEYLAALARPASIDEVLGGVGCSRGVVRRLVERGVVHQFTQLGRLDLERHLVARPSEPAFELHADQAGATEELETALADVSYRGFLLKGPTGSGKTEVYLRAIAAALAAGRGSIVLVPEIALVPVLASTLRQRFGSELAILHSALGRAERLQEWERIRRGEARVVLGPRSAVLAPVERLGFVVVDEEQDTAYKQETAPRYNARDVALYRGRAARAVVLLVSATPSLESRLNVERGKLGPLVLAERVGGGELPEGILVDLKLEGAARRPGEICFSSRLREELEATIAAGNQAVVLRNRRGYSPVLLCRACGEDMRCEDCGLPRTYHRRFAELLCHYCGSRLAAPERCPGCGEAALEPIGTGTERVEEELAALLPGVAIDSLDRDTLRRHGRVAAVLERFASGEIQILVGTQMLAKGHHFPRVALAAVLQADTYLGFPDFRAVERTYALLTQFAGRSGRAAEKGRVVVQTFHPEHYAIQAALTHDDERFAAEEMRFRRVFQYPPFTRMTQLILQDTARGRCEEQARELGTKLEAATRGSRVRVLGPAPAPFEKLRGKWRYQLLLRGPSGRRIREVVAAVVGEHPRGSKLAIDVDPLELL